MLSATYQGLDVEALRGRDLLNVLTSEGSEDSGLTSGIEAENEDSSLTSLLFESAQLRKESHIVFCFQI